MSMRYLGDSFALHGGGDDLIFPHHDAEIAQSENFTGKPFVRHWAHTGMVFCGRHKMSKSLGNMVFVSELLDKIPADALRLLLLSHHYRSAWNFEPRELIAARRLTRLLRERLADADPEDESAIEEHGAAFLEATADDLDTPRALLELREMAEGGVAAERRAARALAERVLGLNFDLK